MRFNLTLMPELIASTDETRANLTHPYLRIESGRGTICATDGRMLVSIPVSDVDADTAGYIPVEAIACARKYARKNRLDTIAIHCGREECTVIGADVVFPRPDLGVYPDFGDVLPALDGDEARLAIGLSLDFLVSLARAIGGRAKGGSSGVTLWIDPDGRTTLAPIQVSLAADSPTGARAVLMPMRCEVAPIARRPLSVVGGER